MPDNQRAIADTSVLIAFEKLNKLDLLCLTYKEIFLPEAVYQEYANDLQNCFILKTAPEPISDFLINHVGLGRGESESIALAHSMGTRVLIDDLKARKIALDFGCRVTGTIGVLYKMEQKKIIHNAFDHVIKLKKIGFHISDKLIARLSLK
jgi:predicted nucleic acid-binding protein